MKRLGLVPFMMALSACSIGCVSQPGSGGGGDMVGETHLAITIVPPMVQCIQVVVTGSSTVTRNLAVTSGNPSITLSLGQLPLGNVTITGSAFSQTCSAISGQTATWIADAQQVT